MLITQKHPEPRGVLREAGLWGASLRVEAGGLRTPEGTQEHNSLLFFITKCFFLT